MATARKIRLDSHQLIVPEGASDKEIEARMQQAWVLRIHQSIAGVVAFVRDQYRSGRRQFSCMEVNFLGEVWPTFFWTEQGGVQAATGFESVPRIRRVVLDSDAPYGYRPVRGSEYCPKGPASRIVPPLDGIKMIPQTSFMALFRLHYDAYMAKEYPYWREHDEIDMEDDRERVKLGKGGFVYPLDGGEE